MNKWSNYLGLHGKRNLIEKINIYFNHIFNYNCYFIYNFSDDRNFVYDVFNIKSFLHFVVITFKIFLVIQEIIRNQNQKNYTIFSQKKIQKIQNKIQVQNQNLNF